MTAVWEPDVVPAAWREDAAEWATVWRPGADRHTDLPLYDGPSIDDARAVAAWWADRAGTSAALQWGRRDGGAWVQGEEGDG